MKFKEVNLYTNQLKELKSFYSQKLGFQITNQTDISFTLRIGWSKLTFNQSNKEHKYHFCFLIPCNQLTPCLEYFKDKIKILNIEGSRQTHNFTTWNSDSFYFEDSAGNLGEFIVRHDLENQNNSEFDLKQVLGVNEIGLPTNDIKATNNLLEKELKTKFWKGDFNRFGTNGNQEGLFLLPNNMVKENWFPTSLKIKQEPFEVVIENKHSNYYLSFSAGKIKIAANT